MCLREFSKEWTETQAFLPISNYGVEVPEWINQDITAENVDAIIYGGCASGPYMPAVTYSTAARIMDKYGNDVIDFIESRDLELPAIPKNTSWRGMCCIYLSYAVELWARGVDTELDPNDYYPEEGEEEEEEEED